VAAGAVRKRLLPREAGERVGRVVLARADVVKLADPDQRRRTQAFSTAPRVMSASSDVTPPSAQAEAWKGLAEFLAGLTAKLSEGPKLLEAPAPEEAEEAPRMPESYTPAPLEPRPWLTLEEAAYFSGLPPGWLKRAAALGNVEAINVGSEKRVSWRFHRDSLRGLLSNRLFSTAGV
jgi:hypothetical protein